MAVRIEFFAIEGTDDFERVPAAWLDAAVAGFDAGDDAAQAPRPVRCVGWLSAADQDEERFTDWCDEVDDDLGLGLVEQGVGESTGVAPPALGTAALASDGEWATGVVAGLLQAPS